MSKTIVSELKRVVTPHDFNMFLEVFPEVTFETEISYFVDEYSEDIEEQFVNHYNFTDNDVTVAW